MKPLALARAEGVDDVLLHRKENFGQPHLPSPGVRLEKGHHFQSLVSLISLASPNQYPVG